MDFGTFFNPRSVAVIGASKHEGKVGHALMHNILKGGERDIYPINPKETEILGKKCYPSVGDVLGDIDLVVIAVRANIVPNVLKECGEKKIPFAIIISAGFKETKGEGAVLEEELKEIAEKYNITLLGPNCLGAIDLHAEFNATFGVKVPQKGDIALLSQSGALGTAMLDWACEENVGLSKFVSLGNEATLSELDFIEHLKDDKDTKAILMYLEQVSDGRRFKKLFSEITKTKPVIVLKAGRSSRGTDAVKSHTGSLAAQNDVFEAVCRQSGVSVVHSLREMFDCAKLFHMEITEPLTNIVVLTNGGGPSIVTTDLIEFSDSLSLINISGDTQKRIAAVLPEMASVKNPIDILGDAPASRYEDVLNILVDEYHIDAIVAILTPQMMTESAETARVIASFRDDKPILPVFIGGESVQEGIDIFNEQDLVNFDFPEDVVRALDVLALDKKERIEKFKAKVHSGAQLTQMSISETVDILEEQDLHLVGVFAQDRDELEKKADELKGSKVAIKIISPDVVHKSDQGAVKVNIEGKDAILAAYDEMAKHLEKTIPSVHIEGVLLQPMIKGKEVIVGMKRDSVFGPTIVFGMGGVFVEVFKDVSMRVPPIDKEMAKNMINEIKGSAILRGMRGEKSVNIDALAKIIVSIAKMSVEHPEIQELDLNPVIINEKDAYVVDVRVMK